MKLDCFTTITANNTAIEVVASAHYLDWLNTQTDVVKHQLAAQQFVAKQHAHQCLYNSDGKLDKVIITVEQASIFALASLPLTLPEGNYHVVDVEHILSEQQIEIGWALGAYQFTCYKKAKRQAACLQFRESQDIAVIIAFCQAIYRTRDLINMSAEQMGPAELAQAAKQLAGQYGAKYHDIVGDKLLKQNFPTIHAVGRGSSREPRLIELNWGKAGNKKVTLVGKGVCFDTGGYDIKTASGMLTMKKDMGGAAHVLGLAEMIMACELPVQLQVLIPAVENSISGSAYRPSDVITTRKGLTVEVGNTDAEGRLILCDALAYAMENKPDWLIDMATLTGAARVALGAEIPAVFSNTDACQALLDISKKNEDLLWQLPLQQSYRKQLESQIADLNNMSSVPWGGAITAALFLQSFVDDVKWIHIDLMAANLKTTPGHPEGGEAQGLRSLFTFLAAQMTS